MKVEPELISYIFNNYTSHFSEEEKEIYDGILRFEKINSLKDVNKNLLIKNLPNFSKKALSFSDEEKNDFFQKTCIRLLNEGKIFVNRCPYCGALARTPFAERAKCGHSWGNYLK